MAKEAGELPGSLGWREGWLVSTAASRTADRLSHNRTTTSRDRPRLVRGRSHLRARTSKGADMTEVIEPARPGLAGAVGMAGRATATAGVRARARRRGRRVRRGRRGRVRGRGGRTTDPTTPGVAVQPRPHRGRAPARAPRPGPIRAACVTATVLAVPAALVLRVLRRRQRRSRASSAGVYLLTLVSYARALPADVDEGPRHLPGRRAARVRELGRRSRWATPTHSVVPFQSEISSSSDSTTFGVPPTGRPFSTSGDTTDALRDCGAGHRTGVPRRRRPRSTGAGYAGAATPFVAVGAIETLAGAIVLGGNDSLLLGGLLAIVAGAVGRARRRPRRPTTGDDVDRCARGVRRVRRGHRRHRAQQRRRASAASRSASRWCSARSRGGSRRCSANPTTATTPLARPLRRAAPRAGGGTEHVPRRGRGLIHAPPARFIVGSTTVQRRPADNESWLSATASRRSRP